MLKKITDFFLTIKNWIQFNSLSRTRDHLVVYSEGSHDWPHIGPMLIKFIRLSDRGILYVSSEKSDPGLSIKNDNFKGFFIGSGLIRIIFFQLLKCKVLLLTLTDLDNFHLKRSLIEKVHYVYCFHSINSMHAVYRKNAFIAYDTIFCIGPHHIKELEREEKIKKINKRNLFEHGSVKIDTLMENYKKNLDINNKSSSTILLAPSWGESSFAENFKLLDLIIQTVLINSNYCVLRLHPMTLRLNSKIINDLKVKNKKIIENKSLIIEDNLNSNESLNNSDLMISDWSGASMEYAFSFKKPVIFINTNQKINNPNWKDYDLPCFEDKIRPLIGKIVDTDSIHHLPEVINSLLKSKSLVSDRILEEHKKNIFNVGKSDIVGAKKLLDILENS